MLIRRILHTCFSLWLACLLLFGVTPKEALHAFAQHRDTVHRRDVGGPVMETVHHHCSFLGFQLLPFDAPGEIPFVLQELLPGYISFLIVQDERATQQAVALRDGRGPPVAPSSFLF